jgi:hypothetical protein
MIIGGTFGFLEGLALIVRGTFYVQPQNYWISTGAATWGWWHLIVGLIVLAAGFGVISGAAWARWLGIIFVSIQALTNFLFIPVQPFWAITLILIDVWIIHSPFVHRREPVQRTRRSAVTAARSGARDEFGDNRSRSRSTNGEESSRVSPIPQTFN